MKTLRTQGCGLLLVLCAANTVHAQTEEELGLRRLALLSAEEAARAGNPQQALVLAERAGAIQMTTSLRRFIALQLRALNRHAEALLMAQNCVREAEANPTLASRETILESCRSILQEERPQVGSLLLQRPATPIAGLSVTVNGRAVRETLFGLPYYVDQGTVAIVAEAPGYAPLRRSVEVTAGATETVTLALTPVAPVVPPQETPVVVHRSVGPYVLWGVAGGMLVGAGVALALRQTAVAGCPAQEMGADLVGVCPDEGALAAAQSIPARGIAAGVLFGASLATFAGGAVWWAMTRTPTRRTAVSASWVGDGVALQWRYRF